MKPGDKKVTGNRRMVEITKGQQFLCDEMKLY